MIVYYDVRTESWFHTVQHQTFTLGVEEIPLLFRHAPSSSSIPFSVQTHQLNLGPLVGILAGRKGKESVVGNGPLFKKLQEGIEEHHGIALVFTLEDIKKNGIKGHIYIPEKKSWLKIYSPFPHIVYNRLPYRALEHSEQYQSALRLFREKKICFFNPSFIDKYQLYNILKREPLLTNFLPETILVKETEHLKAFLEKHEQIYVKPANSAKGKGIFKVGKDNKGSIIVTKYSHQQTYPDYNTFWSEYKSFFCSKPYIAQAEVTPLLYKGNRFDFRILAHFNGQSYQVTGVGVRQSGQQNLTTHVLNGGKILEFDEVKRAEDEGVIEEIVNRCGQILSDELGFFGEFSIDAGLTEQGEYVIYEVNSKPMSFDEKQIEKNRIDSLIALFQQLFKKQLFSL